jgi:formyltetrahydrofolate-dependent phosphoribosylglycinamide formyltransferase
MTSRLVVLISGSGTNLQALLGATADGRLAAQVVLVVSNRKNAYGLVRAEQAGVETLYFPLKPFSAAGRSRQEYDADLAGRVAAYEPDLIVLAGWMHVLSPAFLKRFPERVINLHPALPGAFPGTGAIERAYHAYRRGILSHSGCMIHQVVPEVDAGPVVAQTTVLFEPGDSLADFEARMHRAEHELIVEATRLALDSLQADDESQGTGGNRLSPVQAASLAAIRAATAHGKISKP